MRRILCNIIGNYPIYLTITGKLNISDNVTDESENNDNRYRDIDYALLNEIK